MPWRPFTGATHPPGFNLSIPGLMAFPLLLSLKGNAYGVGHYFGPLILALAPLIPWAFRRRGLACGGAGLGCRPFAG